MITQIDTLRSTTLRHETGCLCNFWLGFDLERFNYWPCVGFGWFVGLSPPVKS